MGIGRIQLLYLLRGRGVERDTRREPSQLLKHEARRYIYVGELPGLGTCLVDRARRNKHILAQGKGWILLCVVSNRRDSEGTPVSQ